ncbi:MAG: MFS transporter [Lachnospiraceae bacterium]|nr:MFS transporter [Lachnospiraceae bacterium]
MNSRLDNSKKTRLYLFIGSSLTIIIVAAFLVVLNINEPAEYTAVPFDVLLILTILACIALGFFYAKGPVFDIEGKLESTNINAMLIAVLIIIQVAFFFEIVAVRQQLFNYSKYKDIRNVISIAEETEEQDLDGVLGDLCKGVIVEISATDDNGIIIYSSDKTKLGQPLPDEDPPGINRFSYVFSKADQICFFVDPSYITAQIKGIVLNLVTVLVTSLFFSVEMVLLMFRLIVRNMEKVNVSDSTGGDKITEDRRMLSSLYYIRQIAFLFYFASRLSAAFIPTMAKTLVNPIKGISDNTAAGLPQSAETLLTCSAIFITTLILEKKGWKLPFISGLVMVAGGTFMSAVSVNLVMFVFARALVGLGYGFCWMTLRNLSLFGRNDNEKLLGFALLNAGIYAGINCGAAVGSILADIFGYRTVFMISAVATLLTSLMIIRMENALLPHTDIGAASDTEKRDKKTVRNEIQSVISLLVFMIAPASIAASYTSYYLPLYFESIGRSVTDVGRAQLLYGIMIVYAGPALSRRIASMGGLRLKKVNFYYNLAISLSLFLPGIGAGLVLPFAGAALLGTADSAGFGVQNNFFLMLPAVKRLGQGRSLSVLSFLKKIMEMLGPFVFAAVIVIGFQSGIRLLAIIFFVMALLFILFGWIRSKRSGRQEDIL